MYKRQVPAAGRSLCFRPAAGKADSAFLRGSRGLGIQRDAPAGSQHRRFPGGGTGSPVPESTEKTPLPPSEGRALSVPGWLRPVSYTHLDLKRREQADDQRSQSGLELDIVDHINTTERSVNTLSGGEAFLASLALALGLSDEVQMSTGIQLDTLFVDEGFGSLDPEALSKAYNTLAGLTEGNRLVGIISHVPEQKERIDKQILVKKEKTGDSKAEICI